MKPKKPDYIDYGMSGNIGKNLRKEIERQLLLDLKVHKIENENLKIDWSESICEGDDEYYLDGYVDLYSGIRVYDANDKLIVVDGWMDYICEKSEDIFLVYWIMFDYYNNGQKFSFMNTEGLPYHINEKLPIYLRK